MKKVLLISPPFERFMGLSRFYYHIGLASLAGVLEQAKIDVQIYDADYDVEGKMLSAQDLMNNHDRYEDALEDYSHPIWQEVKEVILDYKPEAIGVSVLSVTYPSAIHLIQLAKSLCPDAMIFTGGPHATLCPEDLLPYSDYVMTNEGESIIVGVVNEEYPPGIINGERIWNLDSLPFPAIHRLYKIENYHKRDLSIIMSSRGCQNACKFCSSFDLWKCKIARKSPDYFYREIVHLINDYDIHDFFITDDSFTCDKLWLFEFLERIKPLNITWRCFSRIDSVYDDIIDKMIDAGCRHIKFGIESGSPRILKLINKGITVEDIYRADNVLRTKKIKWSAYFIIGFPGETVEDINMTQDLIKKISADSITVNIYTPLPKNRLGKANVDYKKHSFHSPNNNFTECIDDDTFSKLVKETIRLAERKYDEHNV